MVKQLRNHSSPATRGPFLSDGELWNLLVLALKDLPKNAVTQSQRHLLAIGPYSFTHDDLDICNGIVQGVSLIGVGCGWH